MATREQIIGRLDDDDGVRVPGSGEIQTAVPGVSAQRAVRPLAAPLYAD